MAVAAELELAPEELAPEVLAPGSGAAELAPGSAALASGLAALASGAAELESALGLVALASAAGRTGRRSSCRKLRARWCTAAQVHNSTGNSTTPRTGAPAAEGALAPGLALAERRLRPHRAMRLCLRPSASL